MILINRTDNGLITFKDGLIHFLRHGGSPQVMNRSVGKSGPITDRLSNLQDSAARGGGLGQMVGWMRPFLALGRGNRAPSPPCMKTGD